LSVLISQSDLNHSRRLLDEEVVIERGANVAAGALAWKNAWPPVALREEQHFGDRPLRCFAERPPHLPAMLAQPRRRIPRPKRWWMATALELAQLREQSARVAVGLRDAGVRTATAWCCSRPTARNSSSPATPCCGSAPCWCRSACARQARRARSS
jgi:hypothetical protein